MDAGHVWLLVVLVATGICWYIDDRFMRGRISRQEEVIKRLRSRTWDLESEIEHFEDAAEKYKQERDKSVEHAESELGAMTRRRDELVEAMARMVEYTNDQASKVLPR